MGPPTNFSPRKLCLKLWYRSPANKFLIANFPDTSLSLLPYCIPLCSWDVSVFFSAGLSLDPRLKKSFFS